MANIIWTVTNQLGQPMPGVLLQSGQYNTTPCPWGSFTCTSGPGNPIDGTTDANGQLTLNIPYTCPGEWSGNFYADGYDLYAFDEKTGSVTGDIKYSIVMVENAGASGSTNTPKGNAAEGNAANQSGANLAGLGNTGKGALDFLSTYWWLIAIFAILGIGIAVAVWVYK